jgi:D-alanyl-D-alanine carboxypeptidase/D-alanyl-D-alanine-endopeptidase (penicillin-binding protein 4)
MTLGLGRTTNCHPERSAEGAQSKGLVIAVLLVAMLATSPCAIAAPAPIVQPAIGGTPWTADGIAKLDADLDTMLATDPALRGAHVGIDAIDTAGGRQIYAHAIDDEIQPASTLKLVVGSAALDRLGPAYTFVTSAFAAPDKREIVLRAGGDPFLTSSDLQAAAKAVAPSSAYGVYVFVDDRRYDEESYPRGWTWDDFGQSYAPRVGAIAVDEDLITLHVMPGANVGARPTLMPSDLLDLTLVQQSWSPLAGEQLCDTSWSNHHISILSTASTGANGSDDTLDVRLLPSGCPELVGTIPLGAPQDDIDLAVPDERGYVAGLLGTFINGVPTARVVRPIDRLEPAPRLTDATIALWSHSSAPLSSWIGPRFWIPSDNLVGEMLLRELGYVDAGVQGTTGNGIAYEKQWLQRIGIDPATVTLADGCGMSQYDRITPRDLVTILQHDWNGPNRQLVFDSLPVGGARGTIEGIAGTDAAGRVFAKTGSMMHVRGLAGYLATLHHGPVTFAFEVDDWNGAYPALAALRARVLSRIIDD